MTCLKVWEHPSVRLKEETTDSEEIQKILSGYGVRFERWEASASLADDATQDDILAAYAQSVKRLKSESGFQSADVVSLTPDHPDKVAFREKFLSEHIHSDDEIRFFVDGKGLFCMHFDNQVVTVLCEGGDLISVPANIKHWFDMGPEPFFKCIRLFTTPEGWVADFTGDSIADSYPKLGS
ncbi:MAG: cupin [Myxococcota bacterium]|nr:cupin [Myxococcota bacterium]